MTNNKQNFDEDINLVEIMELKARGKNNSDFNLPQKIYA
jgi:hypothetical protein